MEQQWDAVPFYNDTGETVPAGALLEPTGALVAGNRVMKVRKPTRNSGGGMFVNGRVRVPAGKYGQCQPGTPGALLRVHSSDTVTAADTLGSKSGDWLARKGYTGWRPVGAVYKGFVQAVAEAAGGAVAAQLVVKPLADGTGSGWTDGLVQVQSGTGWTDGTEHVWFQPRTSGMKQKSGLNWWSCWDTGTAGGSPVQRYIVGVDPPMVMRQVAVLCQDGSLKYANVWTPDVKVD